MTHRRSPASPVAWSHRLLAEVLQPGTLAVDLTAGNGHDTLFLAETVGPSGLVIAFDIQQQALASSAALLTAAGIDPVRHRGRRPPPVRAGVVLVEDDHQHLAAYLPAPPKVVIANLGYLPGGDKQLVTRPATTLAAVSAALASLAPGGRLALVAYVGHPGGREEAEGLEALLEELAAGAWQVLRCEVLNRRAAPRLLVVERLKPPG